MKENLAITGKKIGVVGYFKRILTFWSVLILATVACYGALILALEFGASEAAIYAVDCLGRVAING